MVKKLLSLVAVAVFSLSLAGSVLAADIEGKVAGIEREGRYITIKSKDGMSVKVRISGSSTEPIHLTGADGQELIALTVGSARSVALSRAQRCGRSLRDQGRSKSFCDL